MFCLSGICNLPGALKPILIPDIIHCCPGMASGTKNVFFLPLTVFFPFIQLIFHIYSHLSGRSTYPASYHSTQNPITHSTEFFATLVLLSTTSVGHVSSVLCLWTALFIHDHLIFFSVNWQRLTFAYWHVGLKFLKRGDSVVLCGYWSSWIEILFILPSILMKIWSPKGPRFREKSTPLLAGSVLPGAQETQPGGASAWRLRMTSRRELILRGDLNTACSLSIALFPPLPCGYLSASSKIRERLIKSRNNYGTTHHGVLYLGTRVGRGRSIL